MEFIYGDAESKPESGRVVAERLIRDGCTLLIGTNDSGSTISVAQAARRRKSRFSSTSRPRRRSPSRASPRSFRNFRRRPRWWANAVARIKELGADTGVEPRTAVILHVNDPSVRAS